MKNSNESQPPRGNDDTAPHNQQTGLSSPTKQTARRLSSTEVAILLDSKETSAKQIVSLLSRAEFANKLGVCRHTIQRMEKRGLIRGIRINSRLIRYRASELERVLKEATV